MKNILGLTRLEKTQDPLALTAQRLPAFEFTQYPHEMSKKLIEIVTVPKPVLAGTHQSGVGIELDEDLIHSILSTVYHDVKVTEILTENDLSKLVLRKPDLVFSGVKYFDFVGVRLWLNDYLDRFGISYMASARKALDNEFDKGRAKNIMRDVGIATARYFTTGLGEHTADAPLPIEFPLFVKPVAGGDSQGVDANSVVNDFTSFEAKVAEIQVVYDSRSLVETYLSGREYSVGIFEDSLSGNLTAMPVEIIVEENEDGYRILDYQTKKDDAETVIAVSDEIVHAELCQLAKAAFKALGGQSFGRIDIKMNHEQVPHFMEANLMPGLREGYFFRACHHNLGLSYEEMILKIAANGLTGETTSDRDTESFVLA